MGVVVKRAALGPPKHNVTGGGYSSGLSGGSSGLVLWRSEAQILSRESREEPSG